MSHFNEWQPIRIYGQGLQPHTGKHWNCEPAWDLTAIYREPDGELRHPDFHRARNGHRGELPNREKKQYIFWDRHIDRRFHIEYPHSAQHAPRVQGHTVRDAQREWQLMLSHRDQYVQQAGAGVEGPSGQIAQVLADSFLYENFEKKPMAPFAENQRQLNNAMEALLHKSYCTGCANAFAVLADVSGLPSRTIGCVGHVVAEVLVDGKWHLVDSVGRHKPGLDAIFRGSYLETVLDPMGDWAPRINDDFRNGLFKRPNGQYHLHQGMWAGPATLRYAASNAYALYPGNRRWGFKSPDGKRLPIFSRSGGFYWPTVHSSDEDDLRRLRRAALPLPMYDEGPSRDYLYHPFKPDQKLRQSLWLDDLDGVEQMELVLSFGPSKASDFSDAGGKGLVLRLNDFEHALTELAVWPPKARGADVEGGAGKGENLICTLTLPSEAFVANSVNWIVLENHGPSLFYVPCLPAAMEPYIAPMWGQTEDSWNPPLPSPEASRRA